MRMRKGMRFRKRLSAAILAAVMMLSSIQVSGGTSYAAEVADDGITSGQTASILTEEDTEDTEAGAKNPAVDGAITDDESQTDNDNPAGGDSQTGNDNPTGGDIQTGDDNPTGDDSQTEDGNPAGDDSQTGDENVSEEEPDEGQVSDDDTEEPSEDTEEPGTEETEEAEAGLKDIDQMDDMTSDAGGITTYAVSSDVKDYVYQQVLAKKDTISLYYNNYKLKFSDVEDLIYALLTEHPDLYFVKSYSSQTIDSDGVSYVRNLFINYIGGPLEEALNAKVDEALSLTAGMSDDMKAIVLHDYLAVNVEVYPNYHTPYYALVEGRVSEIGYALTYKYLLSKAGIESYLVVTSENMQHIWNKHTWNMVKLDGKYYHVDVAMDDPEYDMVGRVKHDNLFRSDANLKDHSGWTIMSGSDTVNYKATDTKYENAFWVESTAPLVFDGNDCYYISNADGSKGLKKASFSDITNTGTLVAGIDAWTMNPDDEEPSGTWPALYSGLYRINGRLFYNDQDSIYSIMPDGTGKRTEFTTEKADNKRIYYSAYRNGEVVYTMQTNPDPKLSDGQTVLTAEINIGGESGSEFDDDVKEQLYKRMLEREAQIDYQDAPDLQGRLDDLAAVVLDEHPELYFVKGYDVKGTVLGITYYDAANYDDDAFIAKADEALSYVTDGMSDDVKAAVLHDYLAINAEWDCDYNDNDQGAFNNAYGVLVNGTAIDKGYALAYKYLLNRAGIESYLVTSESMNRTWNLVKLGDEYYHVDVAMDDPEYDRVGRVSHNNLFRSDTNFGKHKEWKVLYGNDTVDYEATDKKYEYAFWTESTAPLVFDGTDCYYISEDGSVSADGSSIEYGLRKQPFSDINGLGTLVAKIDKSWKTYVDLSDGSTTPFAVGNLCSGLYRINGRLFYNDKDSIYSINPDGTDKRTEFTPEKTGNNQIFYSAYRNGKVVYALQTGPVPSEKQTVLTARIEGVSEPETYHITYELNGGTNSDNNPDTYTPETETIVLEDATHNNLNMKFHGWYKDAEFKEKVTQIPKGSTGDITLYAKWKRKGEGLCLANPHETFTALDGTTISSRADGRPKLLIFGIFAGGGWDGSTNRVDNIRDEISAFEGVDIYVIDYRQYSWDRVNASREEHGCDEMTFAYDTTSHAYDVLMEYLSLAGMPLTGFWPPVICYIDGDDTLQYVQTGTTYQHSSAVDIIENMNKYCYPSGTEGTFDIAYVLDGGTNHKDNPYTYTAETETIVLKDAAKEGYQFEGWYKDAEYKEKVTQIPKGSEGDITLYAKWTKIAGKEGLNAVNPDYTFTTLDDETVSSRADGKPKVLLFFKPGCVNCQQTNRDLSEHIKYFDGVDIYAVEMTQATKEAVASFKITYGCDEITYCYDKDYTNDQCFWNYANIAHVSNGFSVTTPVIVYIDAQNRVQYGTSGWRSYTEILTDLVDYCGYRYGDTEGIYKITYVLDGGTNNGNNPSIYTAETQTIVLQDAVREGYIFEGWYKDAGFNEKVTQILQGSTGDITLYAKWRAGTAPDDPDDPNDPNDPDDTSVYRVVFNVQGHGTAPQTLVNIKAGSTIDSPVEPAADGYRFDGWYKDSACTKLWDFGMDTVQSNLTLYAKWLAISSDGEFAVQEIADLCYNGKAQKPAVSVYDENTPLKAGKDYTLKYYNNTNANKNGALKGETFNNALPYVEITGKGNYQETVKINFNILPASIGNDLRPAAGVTLKVNDQLVKTSKDQKPFGSIKYGRNMKEGTDYTLKLQAVSVRNQNGTEINDTEFTGAKVPADYTGEFMLTVTGTGNYTGSISRTVYVADKAHLMKNMKIALGKDLKNRSYTGSEIELKAAQKAKPANDEFVVTYGKTLLNPGVDYEVSYNNNVGVGKAELVVTGKNGYVGSKTATFTIKGKTFANGTVTVTGLQDQTYTGRAIVQDAVLTWKDGGKTLVYGEDYTVSYSKNINKGTATITFTGKAKAGYSGKVSKKFKITAANISEMTRAQSMNTITLPYTKAGVKPVDEIILTNERGIRLSNGKDYTLAYKNNKAVANAAAGNAPTVTVKGKGNYSGSFEVKFTIESAGLHENSNITAECAQVMYVPKKAQDYEYKPAVTIKDGKTKLKADKDYEIRYERNTQRDFMYYMMSDGNEKLRPVAVITAKAGSGYTLQEPLEVTLQIYHMAKLTKNNLEVEIGEAVYNGGQVRPEVTVWYWWNGERCEFTEGRNYTLIYGTNTAAGKNKGSVTIKGLVPMYGGSVTYKFDIIKKDLKYGVSPVIDEK